MLGLNRSFSFEVLKILHYYIVHTQLNHDMLDADQALAAVLLHPVLRAKQQITVWCDSLRPLQLWIDAGIINRQTVSS